MNTLKNTEKFTGHESFTCRYGWLPKVYDAVSSNPLIFKDDYQATTILGIGRNMVKSLQFWAEAAGIIHFDRQHGHTVSPLGSYLMSDNGVDPYLESTSSIWLIHWNISTKANLSAWNAVFGESSLSRFDRNVLERALLGRAESVEKVLAATTIEQHAAILINSYYKEVQAADDSLWCPLQDLDLIRATKSDSGNVQYVINPNLLTSLSEEAFSIILLDYLKMKQSNTVDFGELLNGRFSLGTVLKLDEFHLRKIVEQTANNRLKNALRFIDTADTQTVTLDFSLVDPKLIIASESKV